ncbi:hypothetical protein [Nocardioides perillae]|uniref:Uncharacterized protein n=1 Tax=Nocardioides perillae TaxID=1119534 RepID=A0A7Y9RRL5_9ACTN|nr:hypothetical protein [Nocardioides perillae]NYG53956.1 hypothetical protein [Nocardioides perillae]
MVGQADVVVDAVDGQALAARGRAADGGRVAVVARRVLDHRAAERREGVVDDEPGREVGVGDRRCGQVDALSRGGGDGGCEPHGQEQGGSQTSGGAGVETGAGEHGEGSVLRPFRGGRVEVTGAL